MGEKANSWINPAVRHTPVETRNRQREGEVQVNGLTRQGWLVRFDEACEAVFEFLSNVPRGC